jgi:hypothetical protein
MSAFAQLWRIQSFFDISLVCEFAQRWSWAVSSASRRRYRMRRLLDDIIICATMAETSHLSTFHWFVSLRNDGAGPYRLLPADDTE